MSYFEFGAVICKFPVQQDEKHKTGQPTVRRQARQHGDALYCRESISIISCLSSFYPLYATIGADNLSYFEFRSFPLSNCGYQDHKFE